MPSQPLRLTSPQLILSLEQLLERSATLEALDEGLAGGRERVQSRAGWGTRVGRGKGAHDHPLLAHGHRDGGRTPVLGRADGVDEGGGGGGDVTEGRGPFSL